MPVTWETSDERFYRWPPVKGTLSVALLALMGLMARDIDDLGLVLGVELVILIPGGYVWWVTLEGFLRDLRPPDQLRGGTPVAWRPRRAAIAMSWLGLLITVIATPIFGAVTADTYSGPAFFGSLAATVIGLLLATFLPRRSQTRSLRTGSVAVSPEGVVITNQGGQEAAALPFSDLPALGQSDVVSRSLPGQAGAALGPQVSWRPGARLAIQRWASEGFLPTSDETRSLHLDPAWSPDPRAHEPTRAQRWGNLLFNAWMVIMLAGFGAVIVGVVVQAGTLGDGNWFVLLIFGIPSLAVAPVFGVRAVRSLRTVHHDADVSEHGWYDILHGRGIIPFEQIDRIEVHDRAVSVHVPPSTLDYPSSRETSSCARLAASLGGVEVARRETS